MASLRHLLILLSTVLTLAIAVEDAKDVVEGQKVRLECRFDPNLAAGTITYYWIRSNSEGKDNAAIADAPLADHYTVDFNPSQGRYDLIIEDAKYNKDDGKFECKLKRIGFGSDVFSKVIKVVVLIPPGEPQVTPSKPIAREGEPFTLTCSSIGGSPDPMISWSHNGQPMNAVSKLGKGKDNPTISRLTIDPKMEDDLSTYKCVVWNRAVREADNRNYEKDVVLEVNYIPRVTVGPYSPLQVMEDSTVTMTCNVHAKPPARNVHWMFNGVIISSAYNHTLTYIRPNDRGNYKCVADNGVGSSGEAAVELQIMYGPKVNVVSRRELSNGETVSIECNVDAVPKAHTIQWLKPTDNSFKQNGRVLTLRRVTAKDSGNYICQAINTLTPFGTNKKITKTGNATLAILIEHKPGKTQIYADGNIAIVGKPYTLRCEATPPGWPEPEFKWWQADRNENVLSTQRSLKFNSVSLADERKYQCQPWNNRGSGTVATFFMKVHEPARILTRLQPDVVRNKSSPMEDITCRAVGKPVPKIVWLKDGKTISRDNGLYTVSTSAHKEGSGSFTIVSTISWNGVGRLRNNIVLEDRGTYTCMVDNNVTKPDSSKMTLHVRGSPKVVHRNKRVAFDLNEKATLECHMQAYPKPEFVWKRNNDDLSSYGPNSRYTTNSIDLPRDVFNGRLVIDSLEERDYGDYTCIAKNKYDYTRTKIQLVKKGPPETPSVLQMVNVSFDEVTLEWTEQFNGGHKNTEFYVKIEDGKSFKRDLYACRRNNPCIVTGLESQTFYSFSVKAANPGGESEFSEAIQVMTKVNLKSIPEPSKVYFDEEKYMVNFEVPERFNNELYAVVEVLSGEWQEHERTEPLTHGVKQIKLDSTRETFDDVRVKLCLVRNEQMCSHAIISKSESQVASPKNDGTLLYFILIPACAIFALAIIILVVCCCRKKGKQGKKDYEMDNQNVRPKAVTGPYYPENITKQDQTDSDLNLKSAIYATNLSGNPGLQNGHMGNGGMHYTDSSHLVSTNSSDNQSDLWIKANGGGEIPNGSYQHYDPPSNNGYMYPDDYHPLNDDVMNQRNRDPYSPPYYDVSGLPDPYQNDEDDKNPQISFDESLESGYSTPNSRNRRVIREIIV